jgi:hypothetical protein
MKMKDFRNEKVLELWEKGYGVYHIMKELKMNFYRCKLILEKDGIKIRKRYTIDPVVMDLTGSARKGKLVKLFLAGELKGDDLKKFLLKKKYKKMVAERKTKEKTKELQEQATAQIPINNKNKKNKKVTPIKNEQLEQTETQTKEIVDLKTKKVLELWENGCGVNYIMKELKMNFYKCREILEKEGIEVKKRYMSDPTVMELTGSKIKGKIVKLFLAGELQGDDLKKFLLRKNKEKVAKDGEIKRAQLQTTTQINDNNNNNLQQLQQIEIKQQKMETPQEQPQEQTDTQFGISTKNIINYNEKGQTPLKNENNNNKK